MRTYSTCCSLQEPIVESGRRGFSSEGKDSCSTGLCCSVGNDESGKESNVENSLMVALCVSLPSSSSSSSFLLLLFLIDTSLLLQTLSGFTPTPCYNAVLSIV